LRYNQELRAENLKLKSKLSLIENEIRALMPAAFFLKTRDALHRQLARHVRLAKVCRDYRELPSERRLNVIFDVLKQVDTEEKDLNCILSRKEK
jgi:hypothetical protein